MKIKLITIIILICIGTFSFSQTSFLLSERKINLYLQSSNQLYYSLDFGRRNVTTFQIDTFNICRIQKNRIKSTSVFYFTSEKDSTLWQFYKYNKDGLLLDARPQTYIQTKKLTDSLKIDCTNYSIEYKTSKKKDTKKNYILIREKVIEKYDSLGYLIEHTVIAKGIIRRWLIVNVFGGEAKFHRYYDYSDNYKNVKCTWCYKEKLRIVKCNMKLVYFFKFDDNRNLLSEMKYRENENGELTFEEGFKYYYEYY